MVLLDLRLAALADQLLDRGHRVSPLPSAASSAAAPSVVTASACRYAPAGRVVRHPRSGVSPGSRSRRAMSHAPGLSVSPLDLRRCRAARRRAHERPGQARARRERVPTVSAQVKTTGRTAPSGRLTVPNRRTALAPARRIPPTPVYRATRRRPRTGSGHRGAVRPDRRATAAAPGQTPAQPGDSRADAPQTMPGDRPAPRPVKRTGRLRRTAGSAAGRPAPSADRRRRPSDAEQRERAGHQRTPALVGAARPKQTTRSDDQDRRDPGHQRADRRPEVIGATCSWTRPNSVPGTGSTALTGPPAAATGGAAAARLRRARHAAAGSSVTACHPYGSRGRSARPSRVPGAKSGAGRSPARCSRPAIDGHRPARSSASTMPGPGQPPAARGSTPTPVR